MSQGGYVTLVGFVAGEPILRKTKDGTTVTDVRVGTTTRVLDRSTGEWRDSDTSYFTVNCWRSDWVSDSPCSCASGSIASRPS